MKNKITLLVIALMVSLSAFSQQLDVAKKYIAMEQWKKAQKILEELTNAPTADSWSKFYMAEVYMEQGKTDDAQAFYDLAAADPKNMFAVAGQGRAFLRKGDLAKAQESFDKAIKGDKRNVDLYAYVADAFLKEKNDTASCSKFVALGKERNIKNINIYFVEAKLWQARGDNGRAADCYDKRINLFDRQNTAGLTKLGVLYSATKVYESAEATIKNALNIDSTYIPAYKALGDIYYWWKGHQADASAMYKKYISLAGEDVTADDKKRYAFALFFNNEYDEAKRIMDELSVANPRDYVVLRLQSYMAYSTKEYKAGLDYATQFFAVQTDPSKYLADDYNNLAKLQVENKLDTLAIDSYVKAFSLDSSNTTSLEDAAKLAVKLKKFPIASKHYETLTRLKPGVPSYFMSLGRAYFFSVTKADSLPSDSVKRKALYALSDTAFKKAIQLNPKFYLGYYWRAQIVTLVDPKSEKGLAKPFYEQTINVILENNADKPKNQMPKELVTCYQFLAAYYYTQAFNLKKTNPEEYQKSKALSLDFCAKGLEIVPTHAFLLSVQKAFEDLEKPQPQTKAKQKKDQNEEMPTN